MPTCFVIQPFDSKFDKRFQETFSPAIKAAGFEPYRVDQDPRTEVLITSIEEGVRSSSVCLADITTDNPNVWYELGFAFATKRRVVMVCSDERTGRYPFDIQHRPIIPYKTEALSDFQSLSEAITARLKAAGERGQELKEIVEAEPIAPIGGLSQIELSVLALAAGAALPGAGFSLWGLQSDAERIGLTKIGANLALKRLMQKQLLEEATVEDHDGDYKGAAISSTGWDWIDANDVSFTLRRPVRQIRSHDASTIADDEIPF